VEVSDVHPDFDEALEDLSQMPPESVQRQADVMREMRQTRQTRQTHEAIVALEHATVKVAGRIIWRDVSFRVRPGEFIAILGPNGSGKSTLLKVLLGLLPLESGQVRVLDRPVRRGNAAIGYLPQRRVFDSDVRIRGYDLVRLGVEGTRWGVPLPGLSSLSGVLDIFGVGSRARAERARIDRVLRLVGATDYATRPIGTVSGGEQQRLLIAQALVTQPRLLLLDEPLEGLDLPNQQAVATVIRRISQEEGVTTLLVAHDVNPILPYLDRVLYMARGKVLIGTPDEVITTETLSQLYDARVEVLRTSDGGIIVAGQPEDGVSHHA
jgi:zinc/manganese transport system ATP-binding protein